MSDLPAGLLLAKLASELGRDLGRAARMAGGPARLARLSSSAVSSRLGLDADGRSTLAAVWNVETRSALPAQIERLGVGYIDAGAAGYPAALGALFDPPFGLFTRGDWVRAFVALAERPVVAIVGSRVASEAGTQFASRLAADLAAAGAVVVSGLARGIDASAHEGAMAAGGITIGVAGCGVDVPYPAAHRDLYRRVADSGAVVSEYWPGTRPAPWRFPARNRIVAGLADAVVVVEATARSGALITADFALEYGRPVLAVPGMPGSPRSQGCHALIRAGAGLCEGITDLREELPNAAWTAVSERDGPVDANARAVLTLLANEPMTPDQAASRLGIGVPEIAGIVALLQLDGFVTELGGRFQVVP